MIFQLLKHLETDVWFCYEGFYYGCTCIIDECSKDSIDLVLKPEDKRKNQELFSNLTTILKQKSSRMHSELRIYFPPKFAKELNTTKTVCLFTEIQPQITKYQLNDLQMKFTNLQGLSKKHSENWKNIISYEFNSESHNL